MRSRMSKRRVGLVMMIIGVLAAAAALGLGGYNLWDNYRAGIQAAAVMNDIAQRQEETKQSALDEEQEASPDPDREMPVLEIDGKRYIGTILIPAVDIELPVQKGWSLSLLRTAPCRYKGSAYQGDLIICAHNYATHFGRLKNILTGDEVIFTDIDGNEFRYTVVAIEILAGTAVDEMESGEWDLTLFTCTLGGKTRITVRCSVIENGKV